MRDLPSLQDHVKLSHTPAGFLLPRLESGICVFAGAHHVLGTRVIEMQEVLSDGLDDLAHRHGTDNSDASVALVLAHSRGRSDLNLTLQSKFSFLSIVRCRFQG